MDLQVFFKIHLQRTKITKKAKNFREMTLQILADML